MNRASANGAYRSIRGRVTKKLLHNPKLQVHHETYIDYLLCARHSLRTYNLHAAARKWRGPRTYEGYPCSGMKLGLMYFDA